MPSKPLSPIQATLTLVVLASGLLSLVPPAHAAQAGGSVGSAEHCTIYNLSKIIAVINAGTEEICLIFDSDTPANTNPVVRLRASGPDNALGVAFTQTWSVISVQGCTAGTLTQGSGASAATSWSNANLPVTFSAGSHQCTGIIQYTLVVATVPILTWQGGWDTDIQSEASYVFNCGNTGTTSEATYPGLSTCNLAQQATCSNTGLAVPTTASTCNLPQQAVFQCAAPQSTTTARTLCNPTRDDGVQTFTTDKGTFFQGPPAVIHIPNTGTNFNAKLAYQITASLADYGSLLIDVVTNINRLSTCTNALSTAPAQHGFAAFAGPGANRISDVGAFSVEVLASADNICTASWSVYISGAGGYYDGHTFTTTFIKDPPQTISVSQNGAWSIDNQNRLCNASALGTACTTPSIAITGSLTVTNAGGQSLVLSGTLDNLNRFCAASATGTACNTPTVNAALSGTVTATLAGTVTLAGGVSVTGTLDTLQRLCAASATGSACTTPIVLQCSTAALAADPKACSGGAGSMANVNTTIGSAAFPSTLHLCGAQVSPGDCTSVQSAGAMEISGLFADPFLHGLLWLVAIVFFLRLGKVLAAAACTMGFAASCIHNSSATVSDAGQLVALLVLGVALWLEAVAREKIYTRWFKPAEGT